MKKQSFVEFVVSLLTVTKVAKATQQKLETMVASFVEALTADPTSICLIDEQTAIRQNDNGKIVLVAGTFPKGEIGATEYETKTGEKLFTSKTAVQIDCFDKRTLHTINSVYRFVLYSTIVEMSKAEPVAAMNADKLKLAKAKAKKNGQSVKTDDEILDIYLADGKLTKAEQTRLDGML